MLLGEWAIRIRPLRPEAFSLPALGRLAAGHLALGAVRAAAMMKFLLSPARH
jgi:hypothetical protein